MAMTPEEKKAARRVAAHKYYEAHKAECLERTHGWQKAHPEACRVSSRKHRAAHRQQEIARNRQWCKDNPEQHIKSQRKADYKRRYGITDSCEKLLAEQNGVCAICGGNRSTRELGIDHDHNTGDIRGMLCGPCNLGLGYFADNSEFLKAAINYLEKTSKITSLTPDT
jgi:hypothetical protein